MTPSCSVKTTRAALPSNHPIDAMNIHQGDERSTGKVRRQIMVFLQGAAYRRQFGHGEFVQDDRLAFQPVQQRHVARDVEKEAGFRHHRPERMQFQSLGLSTYQ